MFRVLLNLFHKPRFRMGSVDNSRIRTTRIRNAQFVSYLSQSDNLKKRYNDAYDMRLLRRKRFRRGLSLLGILLFSWIVIESAKALAIF